MTEKPTKKPAAKRSTAKKSTTRTTATSRKGRSTKKTAAVATPSAETPPVATTPAAPTTTGVLALLPRGGGFLRDPENSFRPTGDDAWVSAQLIREHGLVEGALVTGQVRRGDKGNQLASVETIGGLAPDAFRARTTFDRLVAIDPKDRFRLGAGGNVSMRIVELIAPIGKGTRGLIAAPPQSGKTQILEQLAQAIHATAPATRMI
ncbi:MAG: hypothetical protein R3E79_59615, partial [Caldilineaceae bacterium]